MGNSELVQKYHNRNNIKIFPVKELNFPDLANVYFFKMIVIP
jgi:hypothetical protein